MNPARFLDAVFHPVQGKKSARKKVVVVESQEKTCTFVSMWIL